MTMVDLDWRPLVPTFLKTVVMLVPGSVLFTFHLPTRLLRRPAQLIWTEAASMNTAIARFFMDYQKNQNCRERSILKNQDRSSGKRARRQGSGEASVSAPVAMSAMMRPSRMVNLKPWPLQPEQR